MKTNNKASFKEIITVAILAFSTALMAFDQASLSYLMPFVKPDLGLNNAQIGFLMSGYWVAFGIASLSIGPISEAYGRNKRLFFWIVFFYAILSVSSGFTEAFWTLLVARCVMGLCQGALFPMAQVILTYDMPAERRGVYMSIVGSMSSNMSGLFIAPIVLVQVAEAFSWRSGFFVVLIPGLICACLILKFLKDSDPVIVAEDTEKQEVKGKLSFKECLRLKNIFLCCVLNILFLAYLSLGLAFHPLYLVDVRGLSPQIMSLLMSVVGISSIVFALALPIVSNKIGRRSIMIWASGISLISPLAILSFGGPIWVLAIFMFVGCLLYSTGGLLMGAIPSESVPLKYASTAIGMIVAAGVIVGGLVGPALAGWSADQWGLDAALWIQIGCATASLLIAFALKESAPGLVSKPKNVALNTTSN